MLEPSRRLYNHTSPSYQLFQQRTLFKQPQVEFMDAPPTALDNTSGMEGHSRCYLLELPPELRNMIYNFTLPSSVEVPAKHNAKENLATLCASTSPSQRFFMPPTNFELKQSTSISLPRRSLSNGSGTNPTAGPSGRSLAPRPLNYRLYATSRCPLYHST